MVDLKDLECERIAKRVNVGECVGSGLVNWLWKRWIDTVATFIVIFISILRSVIYSYLYSFIYLLNLFIFINSILSENLSQFSSQAKLRSYIFR